MVTQRNSNPRPITPRLQQARQVDFNARRKERARALLQAQQPKAIEPTPTPIPDPATNPEAYVKYIRERASKSKLSLQSQLQPKRRTKAFTPRGERRQIKAQLSQTQKDISQITAQEKAFEQEVARKTPEYSKPEYKAEALTIAKTAIQKEINKIKAIITTNQTRLQRYLDQRRRDDADEEKIEIIILSAKLKSLTSSINLNPNQFIKEYFTGFTMNKAEFEEDKQRAREERSTAYSEFRQTPQFEETIQVLDLPPTISRLDLQKALVEYEQRKPTTGTITDTPIPYLDLKTSQVKISEDKRKVIYDTDTGVAYLSDQPSGKKPLFTDLQDQITKAQKSGDFVKAQALAALVFSGSFLKTVGYDIPKGIYQTVRHPIETAKGTIEILKTPRESIGRPIRESLIYTPSKLAGTGAGLIAFPSVAGKVVSKLKPPITIPDGTLKIPLRKLKTTPEFLEFQQPLRIGGKETTISRYIIKQELTPPTIELPPSKGLGYLGREDILTYRPPKIQTTQTIYPVIGEGSPIITLTTKSSGRVGELNILRGKSIPRNIEELGQLSKVEQFTWQRLAEMVTGGRPVSLQNVPKILKQGSQKISSMLKQMNLGKIKKVGKDKFIIDLLPPSKAGRRTRTFQTVGEVISVKETPQYDILTGRVIFKDVTKPFARATGKTPSMIGKIIRIKEPIVIGEEAGAGVSRISPADIKKTPLKQTFQNLLVQTQKPMPTPVKIAKPKKLITKEPSPRYGISGLLVGGVSRTRVGDTHIDSRIISDVRAGFSETLLPYQEKISAKTKEKDVVTQRANLNELLAPRQIPSVKQLPQQKAKEIQKLKEIQKSLEIQKTKQVPKLKQIPKLKQVQMLKVTLKQRPPITPVRRIIRRKPPLIPPLIPIKRERKRRPIPQKQPRPSRPSRFITFPTAFEQITGGVKGKKAISRVSGFEIRRFKKVKKKKKDKEILERQRRDLNQFII